MVVLYVGDEALVREETQSVLGCFFQRVDTAIDGVDGLEQYKKLTNKTPLMT